MGDPPVTPDPTTTVLAPDASQLEAWNKYNEYTAQSATNIKQVNNITAMAQQTFNSLDDGLKKLGMSFRSLDNMTSQQAAGFGALSTTILGSKEAFTQLANVDTSRLLTFTGQIKDMQETLKQSPVYRILKKELEDATKAAAAMGDKVSVLAKQAVKTAEEKIASFTNVVSESAMAMLTSADNSLRLQNAMVQLTMQAGNSKDLFEGFGEITHGVGRGFQSIGDVMVPYTKALEAGTAALGGNQELAAKYMAEINRMPGGFKALISPLEIAGHTTDILTSSIEYAVGAGRKQEEVFADMTKAMTEYGVSGKDALLFSSRMSEVADSTGAQFKDVQSALHGVVDEFKTYAVTGENASKMTQGMADSMRSYVSELTAVGVPAQNAVEMFKNYSTQIKSMTIGQQAFLSTMGGGPGGLRGALQVQDDLSKGNFDKIRKQVEQTLKKTSGPLITREEAMKSEQGSAQYVRQMQVLQQGPLGSMAKDPGQADALIRAMKEGKAFKPDPEKKPEQVLQDTMKRGVDFQKGSFTALTEININIQKMLLKGGNANLATTQEMFTAAGSRSLPGGSGKGRALSPAGQERLNANQRTIETPAMGSQVFKQTADAVANLPKTFQDAWKSFQGAIGTGNKESIQQANDKMLAAIKEAKASGNMTDKQKAALGTLQNNFSATKPDTTPGTAAPTVLGPTGKPTPATTYTNRDTRTRSGQMMPTPMQPPAATAGGTGAANTARQAPGIGGGGHGQAVPVMLAPGSAITVNFTGVCPHCGSDVRQSTDSTVAPQAHGH